MISLSTTRRHIACDLRNHGGDTIRGKLLVYLFNPAFRLLLNYRLGRYFAGKRSFLARLIVLHYASRQVNRRGCMISYHADLGDNVRFPHPLGIVIGEGVVVEDGVRIWQHVTLGSHGRKDEEGGYPTIRKGVRIFANAVVFGNITVGADAVIGANAVVNRDVPDGAIAVGNPAKNKDR